MTRVAGRIATPTLCGSLAHVELGVNDLLEHRPDAADLRFAGHGHFAVAEGPARALCAISAARQDRLDEAFELID